MESLTVAEVTEALTKLAREDRAGAIAFDGDGTLWSGDVGEDFFHALLERGLDDGAVREALVKELPAGMSSAGTATEIARRIHEAYVAGTFDEERMCEIMTWAPAGATRDAIDRFADGVIASIRLTERLHAEALDVFRFAREAGIDVFLVSASPRPIVEAAARVVCAAWPVDPNNVVSVHEDYGPGGRIACGVLRPISYGRGKVLRLREKLGARPLFAAFGDNAFDTSMLAEARIGVAVRPKQRLLDRAAEVPGLRLLTRS